MTQFSRLFNAWATPSLESFFGEDVVYLPRGLEENAREIVAKIDRTPATSFPEFQHLTGFAWIVRTRPSTTDGITAEEIDTGTDTIRIKLRPEDETAREFRIVSIRPPMGGLTRVLVV